MTNPLIIELLKSARQPKFSGRSAEWVEFTMAWESYWNKVSAGQTMDDEGKMQLFEECLDQTSRLDITTRRMQGELVNFNRYYTHLETKFGRGKFSMVRKALLELELRSEDRNKVTLESWRDFSVKFQNLVYQANVGEEEAYQRLLEKIGTLRKVIVEKEIKVEKKAPAVEVQFPFPMTEEDIVEFLAHEVGETPKTLNMQGPSRCRVTFQDKKVAERVVGLNERRVEEGSGKKIRATLVETRVNLWEAMNFVTEKLEEDERKSLKLGPQKEQQQEYRRRAYAVGLEPETSQIAVTEVRAEQKNTQGKGGDPSRAPNPPPKPPVQPQVPSPTPVTSQPVATQPPAPQPTPNPLNGKGAQGSTWQTAPAWQTSQGRGFQQVSQWGTPNFPESTCRFGNECTDTKCYRWHPRSGKSKGKGGSGKGSPPQSRYPPIPPHSLQNPQTGGCGKGNHPPEQTVAQG
jgi:hypothetical protein